MRKTRSIILSIVACVGLLVPAVSGAAVASETQSANNSNVQACIKYAKAQFNHANKLARKAKRAFFKSAKSNFREAAAPHKKELKKALAAATDRQERQAAKRTFKEAIRPLKKQRRADRRYAIQDFKTSKMESRRTFKANRKACRAAAA